MNIRIAINNIFDYFFPHVCYMCKTEKTNNMPVCENCKIKIPEIKEPICPACGGENDGIFEICSKCLKEEQRPWHNATAVANYKSPISEIIKDLKYNNKTYYAKLLGELAAETWQKKNIKADYIVPVPMHWSRRLFRGYNQSELIASVFSEKTGIPILNLLKRVKRTPKQANLSRAERKNNLMNAFKLNQSERAKIKNGSILLFDDVLTTGSTLESACITILQSGCCKIVNILVIARG